MHYNLFTIFSLSGPFPHSGFVFIDFITYFPDPILHFKNKSWNWVAKQPMHLAKRGALMAGGLGAFSGPQKLWGKWWKILSFSWHLISLLKKMWFLLWLFSFSIKFLLFIRKIIYFLMVFNFFCFYNKIMWNLYFLFFN